ncbi:MAG: PAS domain S-box protein [Candidatus Hydrogenedentes bacterium]|mgnify:CR=1 FL=1|nr:PAS domain S-box protein [Candidatus Hydrogenedentota bacterium]
MKIIRSETYRRLTFYVIPVFIGLGGVVYSQQLDSLFWRYIALIISVTIPLYTGSSLLSRYQTGLLERLGIVAGVLMLILGAAYSVSGLTDSLAAQEYGTDTFLNISQVIGMLSLFLGLFVVLYTVIRTGAGIDEMADRFRFLAEHISEGFILSTPEGTIMLVNQQALDMFGMQRHEILGRNARNIAADLGLDMITRQFDSRAGGIASEYEVVWHVNEGEHVFLINGAPIFNKQGRHTLTMATVRDVTEHRRLTERVEQSARNLKKQVEEQTQKLHQSENRLRHLLYSMNEGFLTLDMQYRIRFVNSQACTLFKSSADAIEGREIFDYVDNVGRSRILNLFVQATSEPSGKGLRQEVEFIDANGNAFPALAGVVYLSGQDEHEAGYSLAITPIADLKRMQQQLVVRARELERVNEELRLHDRAKDSFLSNVTHELRTPLTTIQGYIEMFLGNSMGDVSEAQRHALAVMERNAKHLLLHINEMIEFSRMQIKGIQLAINLYDAVVLGKEALAAILPTATEKHLKVSFNAPDSPVYAWGDRDKLRQLLGILLNNAVKFTEPEGSVILSVTNESASDILFSVRDTGIGIDPAYHEKIFTRFFQVDSSKTRKYEGAGIGLSIAQNIVHAHGGNILLTSSPGHGSAFQICIPNSVFSRDVDSVTSENLYTLRVLIIEENDERRDALCSFPPLSKCLVSFAANGYMAARKLNSDGLDIIIVNDIPADTAGETTLRFLRQQSDIATVPVIVLTHESTDLLKRHLGHDTQTRFLFKPFPADALVQLMAKIVSGGIDSAADDIHDLYESTTSKPYVVVLDTDPGFLEWVECALKYRTIDSYCASSPSELFEKGALMRPPIAIFIDADVPARQRDELLQLLHTNPVTSKKPLFLLTSMDINDIKLDPGKYAGILHKPFPISDMTEIIHKLRENPQ